MNEITPQSQLERMGQPPAPTVEAGPSKFRLKNIPYRIIETIQKISKKILSIFSSIYRCLFRINDKKVTVLPSEWNQSEDFRSSANSTVSTVANRTVSSVFHELAAIPQATSQASSSERSASENNNLEPEERSSDPEADPSVEAADVEDFQTTQPPAEDEEPLPCNPDSQHEDCDSVQSKSAETSNETDPHETPTLPEERSSDPEADPSVRAADVEGESADASNETDSPKPPTLPDGEAPNTRTRRKPSKNAKLRKRIKAIFGGKTRRINKADVGLSEARIVISRLFLNNAIAYLDEEKFLKVEGIFRISPSLNGITEAEKTVEQWTEPDQINIEILIENEKDDITKAIFMSTMIKRTLRHKLPPIISLENYKTYLEPHLDDLTDEKIDAFYAVLSDQQKDDLKKLLLLMKNVEKYSEQNKMCPKNLGTVVAPNLFEVQTGNGGNELINALAQNEAQSKLFVILLNRTIADPDWFSPKQS